LNAAECNVITEQQSRTDNDEFHKRRGKAALLRRLRDEYVNGTPISSSWRKGQRL